MANNQQLSALIALQNQGSSLDALGKGHDAAVKRYDKNYYDPYTQAGDAATGAYSDALGLGGAEGNKRSTSAFQAGPGYQFSLDEGLKALDRSALARGMFSSGNHSQDIIDYSQGRANQEFGGYIDRLGRLSGQGLDAAGGQTGRQGSLAGLDFGLGQGQAGVYQNTTKALSDILGQREEPRSSGLGSVLRGGLNLATQLGGAYLSGGLKGIL